jgi:hypothetical protein
MERLNIERAGVAAGAKMFVGELAEATWEAASTMEPIDIFPAFAHRRAVRRESVARRS